ncbi:predicted protein [Arabidopsis lyrata subsp. lyrata]|uniref:Predicted protein n=1 Tax=Arabidopsis lyrata subsp. lyrata TaxID=81972 RepID=D7L6R8_ARALL|nr:predicted protein [Arabidopsis lyrata subsp. lyrata]
MMLIIGLVVTALRIAMPNKSHYPMSTLCFQFAMKGGVLYVIFLCHLFRSYLGFMFTPLLDEEQNHYFISNKKCSENINIQIQQQANCSNMLYAFLYTTIPI